ncbi:MAG: RrF2 family transcriptional regulator [Bacteroidales bacterium]
MFKKKTEYALRGLVYIQVQNNNGHKPSIVEIAEEVETPKHFMAKVLQRLVQHGFLESTKGKNGGYSMSPKHNKLSLKEIVVAIEGDNLFCGCAFGLTQCDEDNPCPLHENYAPIRAALNEFVSNESIQNLVGTNPSTFNFALNRKEDD